MSFSVSRLLMQCSKWNKIASYNFHTTCITHSDMRRYRGVRLAEYRQNNPNRFGPLTNLPDYTFMDGRPTPLGVRQTSRFKRHQEYAQKIVKAIKEVDFAKDRYQRMTKAAAEERQSIIDGKLKPKGTSLQKK